MFSGAYSQRYQKVENHHLEQLKQNSVANRGDVLAKSKLLSHETNRRRRALAIKRKVEAQREEKRRQEILFKRRERQKEATEKFQRQTSRKTPRAGGEISPPKSPTSRKKTSPNRGVTSILIPGLEEALKAVRGNPPGKRPGSGGLITCHMDNDALKSVTQTESTLDGLRKAFHNKYASQSTTPAKDRVQEQVKEQAARLDLHNRSLKNLTNSRSLFEQQLEHHQQLLQEQHQKALQEFNTAICREIEDDTYIQNVDEETEAMGKDQSRLHQTESLSSLDSLEAHCSPEKENSFTDIGPVTSDPVTPALGNISSNRTAEPSIQDQRSTSTVCNVDNSSKVNDGKLPLRNPSSSFGIPFVDSSRSDITVDTVSTIDIREGIQQQQTAGHCKQFFLPRYDMFANNERPSQSGSGMVNEWVSEQNEILTKSPSPAVLTPVNDSKVLQNGLKLDNNAVNDAGTFYVKSWAPSSNTATRSVASVPKGAPLPANNISTVKPVSSSQIASQQQEQHNVKVQQQNQANLSQSAKISSNSSMSRPPQPVKQCTSSTISYAQSSMPTNTTLVVSDCSVQTIDHSMPSSDHALPPSRIPVQVKTVSNLQPSILSNGGLGVSNACLTINGEGSEQGSDTRSDLSDCSKQNTQTKKTTSDVKGILKKDPSISGGQTHFRRSHSFGGKATGFDVRDSLEVMRRHHKPEDKVKPKKKKSVRFADFEDVQGEISQKQQEETVPIQPSPPQKISIVTHKPPRPTSAKVSGNSPKDNPSAARRIVSAGTVRSSPQDGKTKQVVRPQAAAHIITHQSSFTSPVTTANGYQISLVSPPNNRVPHNSTRSHIASTKTTVPLFERTSPPGARYPQPVYDDMGLRLDRTPTDDEINWLWDKVRTCLHRDSQTSSRTSETTDNSARQTVLMSSKVFDGTMLGPHANVSRVAATNLRRYNSAESVNSYSKRSALLQQRQQQPPHIITPHRPATKQGHPSGPQQSPSSGPIQSPKVSDRDPHHALLNFNQTQDVSESLAGFLAAETLANQSVSESVMHNAVDLAQQQQQLINSNRPHNNVPTALSIEERRLMESIDKLNEKLKITENNPQKQKATLLVAPQQQQQQYVHKPSLVNEDFRWRFDEVTSGFRGHQPLGAANKPSPHPAVKIHYRTGSGTVSHAHTQYKYY